MISPTSFDLGNTPETANTASRLVSREVET
jgi:hypothetical protein